MIDEVELAALDQFLGLGDLFTVDAFAAPLSFNERPFDRAVVAIVDPLSEQCLLVGQALHVLVEGTDARNANVRSTRPLRGTKGGSKCIVS